LSNHVFEDLRKPRAPNKELSLFVKKFNKFMRKRRVNLEGDKHQEEMPSMIENVLSVGNLVTLP
jgi:hypothetical protein